MAGVKERVERRQRSMTSKATSTENLGTNRMGLPTPHDVCVARRPPICAKETNTTWGDRAGTASGGCPFRAGRGL